MENKEKIEIIKKELTPIAELIGFKFGVYEDDKRIMRLDLKNRNSNYNKIGIDIHCDSVLGVLSTMLRWITENELTRYEISDRLTRI